MHDEQTAIEAFRESWDRAERDFKRFSESISWRSSKPVHELITHLIEISNSGDFDYVSNISARSTVIVENTMVALVLSRSGTDALQPQQASLLVHVAFPEENRLVLKYNDGKEESELELEYPVRGTLHPMLGHYLRELASQPLS
ncbi:MAG: hypothetical protein AAF125_17865 [Chloroflexota bacterium]